MNYDLMALTNMYLCMIAVLQMLYNCLHLHQLDFAVCIFAVWVKSKSSIDIIIIATIGNIIN